MGGTGESVRERQRSGRAIPGAVNCYLNRPKLKDLNQMRKKATHDLVAKLRMPRTREAEEEEEVEVRSMVAIFTQ